MTLGLHLNTYPKLEAKQFRSLKDSKDSYYISSRLIFLITLILGWIFNLHIQILDGPSQTKELNFISYVCKIKGDKHACRSMAVAGQWLSLVAARAWVVIGSS